MTPKKPVPPKKPAMTAKAAGLQRLNARVKAKPLVPKKVRAKSVKTPVAKAEAPEILAVKATVPRTKANKSAETRTRAKRKKITDLPALPDKPEDLNLDASKLPIRWQLFIEEYLLDLNGTQAAIRAGFSPGGARTQASEMLSRPDVRAIVQARVEDRLEAIRMTRERVLDAFSDIAEVDQNELSEHRRVCCRHCHGAYDSSTGARARQLTPAEWVRKRDAWEERRKELLAEKKRNIGPFKEEAGDWYDKRLPINPECNECFGDGDGEVLLKDTRNISRRARMAYQGVKEGKDGIEIKSVGRGEALGVLAKHHKIYDEAPQVNISTTTSQQLDDIYARGVADAQAAKDKMVGRGDRVRAAVPKDGAARESGV